MTAKVVRDGYDVAIVGLGPTGATLANLLGLCGLSVLALDRFRDPYPLPRAVHFDDEIMRVFQTIGVADRVADIVRVNVGMRFVDEAGDLLLDWPRPQEVGPNGWYASYRFHQPDLELILREALNRYAHVDIRAGCEVGSVADRGDSVEIRFTDTENGSDEIGRARYVVGCDGANSIVRHHMQIEEENLGFNERWLVTDLLLKRPKPELGDHTIQYCNPKRPATYARGPGLRRRWEIAVLENETAEHMCEPATVWRLLRRWINPQEAEIERAAVYTFQSVIARQWRVGRLLIAGDAAHRTPPFMGQGMCAGIRDAANLAWKLALAVRGLAPPAILDSYGTERSDHARQYIETAIRLGRLINASGSRETLDSAFRQSDGSVRMESISPRLGAGLEAGDKTLTGTPFPQPVLDDGVCLDDRVGYRAALIVDRGFWQTVNSTIANLTSSNGVCVIECDRNGSASEYLATNRSKAVLVRPDRYVLGSAGDHDSLAELLSAVSSSPLAG